MPVLSTTAAFGFDADPARTLAAFAALGCAAAQFYRNPARPPSLGDARRIAERAGMCFDAVHGVFGADIDPSSPDSAHRAHCLAIYREEAVVARELGAPRVIVHPAAYRPGGQPPAPEGRARRRAALDEFARRLAEEGERSGVRFLLENLPPGVAIGDEPDELRDCVASIASPCLRMCLDLGHAHLSGDAPASIRSCAEVVDYLHIHDNDRRSDLHLFPAARGGTIDWDAVGAALRQLRLGAPRMLEVFAPIELIEGAASRGAAADLARWCAL